MIALRYALARTAVAPRTTTTVMMNLVADALDSNGCSKNRRSAQVLKMVLAAMWKTSTVMADCCVVVASLQD